MTGAVTEAGMKKLADSIQLAIVNRKPKKILSCLAKIPDSRHDVLLKASPGGGDVLYYAITNGWPKIYMELIRRDFEITSHDGLGRSKLHIAASCGRDGLVPVLLARELDPNHKDNNGATPLLYAIVSDHAECVKRLLEGGADPFIAHHDGRNPFAWAQGNPDKKSAQAIAGHFARQHERQLKNAYRQQRRRGMTGGMR